MADVIVTIKIMPENPEVNLEELATKVNAIVEERKGSVGKTEQEPVAFGIMALNVTFVRSEDVGSTDDIEDAVRALDGVESAEVSDVRRTIG